MCWGCGKSGALLDFLFVGFASTTKHRMNTQVDSIIVSSVIDDDSLHHEYKHHSEQQEHQEQRQKEIEKRLWEGKEDIWREILSYLDDPIDISSWLCVSKHSRQLIQRSPLRISLRNRRHGSNWKLIPQWLNQFQHLTSLELASNNCKDSFFAEIQLHSNLRELAISKCFSMVKPSNPLLKRIPKLALTGFTLSSSFGCQLSDLQMLILSNSTFSFSTMVALLSGLPASLRLLGLGGCDGLAALQQIEQQQLTLSADWNPLPQGLVVEMTFATVLEKEALRTIASHCPIIDLQSDPLYSLDDHFRSLPSMSPHLWTAFLSCSTPTTQRTPLHNACICGDADRVRWLLSRHARVDLKDSRGCLPLHRAVDVLLSKKSMESSVSCTKLCLSASLWGGDDLVYQTCLTRNQAYETALYSAALTRNHLAVVEILRVLKSRQPFPSATLPWVADHGRNQHHACSGKYCSALVSPLLDEDAKDEDAGGDDEQEGLPMYRKWYLAFKNDILHKTCDARGYTPLHAAILSRSYETCELLLQSSLFCPNSCNSSGITAVHISYRLENTTISSNYECSSSDIRGLLVSYGGQEGVKDQMGNIPSDYREGSLSSKKGHHSRGKKRGGSAAAAPVSDGS
jgi:hypothetical protein